MFSNGAKHSFALVGSYSGYIVKYGGFSAPFLFLYVFVLFASAFTHTVDSRGIKIK